MAHFADGVNPDLSLLQPCDDEFLQELLGSEDPSLDGVSSLVSPPPTPRPQLVWCMANPATSCCAARLATPHSLRRARNHGLPAPEPGRRCHRSSRRSLLGVQCKHTQASST